VLTHTTSIAVEALIYMELAPHAAAHTPRELASALDESPSYMQKVLQRLVEAGILTATRGAKGGVYFTRPAAQISLLDCMRACQDSPRAFHCSISGQTSKRCGVARAMQYIDREIEKQLGGVTIAQLAIEPCPAEDTELARLCMFTSAHCAVCRLCSRSEAQVG
jgi:Rrf2 family protein